MDDPKITLLNLLESNWDAATLGFTPKFSADWYEKTQDLPQITITQEITNQRHVFFSDDVTTTDRLCNGQYTIDVWTFDNEQRWQMVEEVLRIVKANCNAPGGGLEFIQVLNWFDLDEAALHPKLLRTRIRLNIMYWG